MWDPGDYMGVFENWQTKKRKNRLVHHHESIHFWLFVKYKKPCWGILRNPVGVAFWMGKINGDLSWYRRVSFVSNGFWWFYRYCDKPNGYTSHNLLRWLLPPMGMLGSWGFMAWWVCHTRRSGIGCLIWEVHFSHWLDENRGVWTNPFNNR